MAQYRVKPRATFGPANQFKPGDIVELAPEEAAGFLDKLELAEAGQTVAEPSVLLPSPGLRNDLKVTIPEKEKLLPPGDEVAFKINSPEDDAPVEIGKPKPKTQRKKSQ